MTNREINWFALAQEICGCEKPEPDLDHCDTCGKITKSIITGGSPRQHDSPEEIYWSCDICGEDKGTEEVR